MKTLYRSVVLLLSLALVSFSQQVVVPEVGSVGQQIATEAYGIPGSHLLRQEEQKLLQYLKQHPEVLSLSKPSSVTAWNFNVGDTKAWWATNLVTNSEYQVPSTCRAVGTNAYFFVEDSLWNRGRVTQSQVDSMRAAFDLRTPAFPTKGIFEVDTLTFGSPPDVDNDPKIIVLILDIKDGYTGSGGFVAGYFFSLNEFPDGTFPGRRSNFAEIFYLDGDPLNLSTSGGLTTGIQTTAHEFQHMIHWKYDPSEITFINEGCSLIAEVVTGYPLFSQSQYASNTNVYLFRWSSDITASLSDYSRAGKWMVYLYNQFPNGYLKKLVQNTSTGIDGMNAAFAAYPTVRMFDDVFVDWGIANYLNDQSVDTKYGYTYTPITKSAPAVTYFDPNVSTVMDTARSLAAKYIRYASGSNLSIMFATASSNLVVKAIEIGNSSKRVLDVPVNTPFQESAFGTTYTDVTFVVLNRDRNSDVNFSYSSSGTSSAQAIETKYDDGAGYGALTGLSTNDTVAVYFDAVAGGTLDSIRIAFRRPGSINIGIWRYTGVLRPTPLGSVLKSPSSLSVAPADTNGGPFPTSESTTKWTRWDVRSSNISTSNSFVVAAAMGVTPTIPGVMVAKKPNTGSPDHSYTFLNSQSPPNWFYLTTDGGANLWIYMIRAYAHVSGPSGVEQVFELLPTQFLLRQNYPNPFNPRTLIEYQLPNSEFVTLSVYDILGREVRTLVSESQLAGTYRVDWDGRDNSGNRVVSGVYFYQIRTSKFVRTNKMVLLR